MGPRASRNLIAQLQKLSNMRNGSYISHRFLLYLAKKRIECLPDKIARFSKSYEGKVKTNEDRMKCAKKILLAAKTANYSLQFSIP